MHSLLERGRFHSRARGSVGLQTIQLSALTAPKNLFDVSCFPLKPS